MASRGTAVIIRDIMWDNRLPIWICSRSSSSTPSLSARTHHSAWCPAGVTWWPRVTPFGRPSSHARERKAHPSFKSLHLRCGRWVPTIRCPIKRRGSRVYNGGRCATCVPSVTRTSRWIGRCGARTGQSRGRSAGRERPRVCIEGSARFSLRNSQVKIPIGALRTVILESFRRTFSCFRCGPLIAPARAATVKVECLL